MKKDKAAYWFKRRRYGYGWTPFTWQGWLVVAGYVAVVIALAAAFLNTPAEGARREAGIFALSVLILTGLLMRISTRKGPKAKWRWGWKDGDRPEEDF